MQHAFVNELGNAITVSAEALPVDGVPGVRFTIEGPSSVSENFVTRAEAQALHEALGRVLAEDTGNTALS